MRPLSAVGVPPCYVIALPYGVRYGIECTVLGDCRLSSRALPRWRRWVRSLLARYGARSSLLCVGVVPGTPRTVGAR